MTHQPPDEPDLIAEVDQQIEVNKQLARLVGAYFWNLIAQGVPMAQAADLTVAYQDRIMDDAREDD